MKIHGSPLVLCLIMASACAPGEVDLGDEAIEDSAALQAAGINVLPKGKTLINVCTNGELDAALRGAKAGQEIVLCDKTWQDVNLSVNVAASSSEPFIVRAKTSGSVTLTGNSLVRMSGSYVVMYGFRFSGVFTGGANVKIVEFRNKGNCNNCRLSETAFDGYSPKNSSLYVFWVSVWGAKNRVDHCSFKNMRNFGSMLQVKPSEHSASRIDHNYFERPVRLDGSDSECMQIGSTFGEATIAADTRVDHNYLYKCSGEGEAVSVKSSHNVFEYNVLDTSLGSVTNRNGQFNRYYHNFVFGKDEPLAGGFIVHDRNNSYINNYIEGTNSKEKGGIKLGDGDVPFGNGDHAQVVGVEIVNTTFVNNVISLKGGEGGPNLALPTDIDVKDSIFYSAGNDLLLNIASGVKQLSFSGTYAFGSNPGYSSGGILRQDPKMKAGTAGLLFPTLSAAMSKGFQLVEPPIAKADVGPTLYTH